MKNYFINLLVILITLVFCSCSSPSGREVIDQTFQEYENVLKDAQSMENTNENGEIRKLIKKEMMLNKKIWQLRNDKQWNLVDDGSKMSVLEINILKTFMGFHVKEFDTSKFILYYNRINDLINKVNQGFKDKSFFDIYTNFTYIGAEYLLLESMYLSNFWTEDQDNMMSNFEQSIGKIQDEMNIYCAENEDAIQTELKNMPDELLESMGIDRSSLE